MTNRFANAHPLVRLHDAAFEESHDYREQMKFKMMLYFNDECPSWWCCSLKLSGKRSINPHIPPAINKMVSVFAF